MTLQKATSARRAAAAGARPRRPKRVDQVTDYARRVVKGQILTNTLVFLACDRHLRDLKRKDLAFDVDAAEKGIAFFRDVLKLEDDRPFVLSPHQAFIFGSLYGWKLPDGALRYRIAYVEVAKGDGKSPSGAGFINRGVCAEGQQAAECYVAAAKKEQAMIAFRDCERMRNSSPALKSRLVPSGKFPHTWNLAHVASGSFARPISSENAQSGPRVFRALIDELHEHKTSLVLDMMVAGTKGRRNALILIITNSGFGSTSVCWREHEYSVKVLRGELDDDRRFAFIAGLDPCDKHREKGHEFPVDGCADCDDWRDERVWLKANPNLGVTITHDYLRQQVKLAMGMPAMENVVKRLNFCIWTEAADRWIAIEVWDRNAQLVPLEQLEGQECWGGADLGMTDDLCALSLLFPRGELPQITPAPTSAPPDAAVEEEDAELESAVRVAGVAGELQVIVPFGAPWPLHTFFWMPEEAFRIRLEKGKQPWGVWRDAGLVAVTPGAMTDYAFIRRAIQKFAERFVLRNLAIDRWNASYLITQLQGDGIPVMLFGQGFQDMSAPTKLFGAMLRAGMFAHGGNQMLRWQATNVSVKSDEAGNLKPDKKTSGDKIDGPVSAIEALGAVLLTPRVNLNDELCLEVY